MSDIGIWEIRYKKQSPDRSPLAAVQDFVQEISRRWWKYLELRDRRDAFLQLQRLDDRTLADIGLNRADVEGVARLPLEVNAAHELEALRRSRKLNS